MSGRPRFKRNRRARNTGARKAAVNRRQAVGPVAGAGAFLAFGINTFGVMPVAHADAVSTDPYVALTISGVGDGVDEVAVSPVGPEAGDIYVASPVGRGEDYLGTVSVIDPSSNTVVHTIDIGPGYDGQLGLAISPTGPEAGDIYVTDPDTGTLSVIDASSNTVVHTIDIGPGENGPLGVAVSPTGPEAGDIYVTPYNGDTVSVIDPSTNTIAHTVEIAGGETTAVAISPTGPEAGDIYVGDLGGVGGEVSVIDPSTNNVVHTINLGAAPIGLAVSPTGPEAGDIYVIDNSGDDFVSVIDPSTNTVVHTIDVGGQPDQLAISPTGPEAGDIYVTLNGQCGTCMAMIDPSTNTVTAAYAIDGNVGEDSAVAVSASGPEAGDIYATDGSNLKVIDGGLAGPPSDGYGFPADGNHIADWLFDGQNPSDVTYDQNWYLDIIPNYENDPGGLLRDAVLSSLDGAGIADHLNGIPDGSLNTALAGVGLINTAGELQAHFGGMVDGNFVDYLHTIIEAPQFVFTAAGALGTDAAVTDPALEPVVFLDQVAATGLGGLDSLLTGLFGH